MSALNPISTTTLSPVTQSLESTNPLKITITRSDDNTAIYSPSNQAQQGKSAGKVKAFSEIPYGTYPFQNKKSYQVANVAAHLKLPYAIVSDITSVVAKYDNEIKDSVAKHRKSYKDLTTQACFEIEKRVAGEIVGKASSEIANKATANQITMSLANYIAMTIVVQSAAHIISPKG